MRRCSRLLRCRGSLDGIFDDLSVRWGHVAVKIEGLELLFAWGFGGVFGGEYGFGSTGRGVELFSQVKEYERRIRLDPRFLLYGISLNDLFRHLRPRGDEQGQQIGSGV